jgi:predicted anti-sigma-YlaC factor YlaD
MNNGADCREITQMVWSDGPEAVPADHFDECASCRAEARQAADLRAALSGLQAHLAEVPASLETAILDAVGRTRFHRARHVIAHPTFRRGAAVGAAAAAAAATAAVGVLVARRRVAAKVAA